jgi:hypothetical protein
MSKVIVIFIVFLTILAAGVAILSTVFLPNSLEAMKTEIVETSAKSGFETKIEAVAFKFPDLVEFSGVSVSDFLKNIQAHAETFVLEISFWDYAKAVLMQKFKKTKIGINDFSDCAEIKNIKFSAAGKEIFSEGKANLRFENGSLKYNLSADKGGYSYFPIKEIKADGIIDSGFFGINSNFKILGGSLTLKADYDINACLLKNTTADFSGIEIKDVFPAYGVSGKISGSAIVRGGVDIRSNFAQILKEKQASCSIEISGFRYGGDKYLKPILNAVAFLGIRHLDFSKITADIDYSRSKVLVNSFLADNFKYAVLAGGYYIPDNQKIDFDIQIRFNPDMKSAMRKEIWNALIAAEPKNEGRKISGRVSGNINNYSVSLDNDVMKKGVNSLLKELEKLF